MDITNPRKEYNVDNHITYSCDYYVVFCSKYGRKVLEEPIAKRLKELVLENQEKYGYKIRTIDVQLSSVSICLSVGPMVGIHSAICKIKGQTSRILRDEFSALKTRLPTLWTRNTFVSSIGTLNNEDITKFILEQRN